VTDALLSYLRRQAGRGLPVDLTEPLRVLKTSGSQAVSAPIKLFVFCSDALEPRVVCRAARHPRGDDRLQAEWHARHEIQHRLDGTLHHTIPAALALDRVDGCLMLIEQGMPGTALSGPWRKRFERRRRRVRRDLGAVQGWLASFQASTHTDTEPWSREDEDGYVGDFFARLGRWFRPRHGRELETTLRRAIAPLRGVPVVWSGQHGDFWHGNVLSGPRGICVVDWEVACLRGPAFVDVLTFGFQYLFWQVGPFAGRDTSRAIPTWLHRAVAAFVRAGVGTLADDAAQLDAAFLVTLLARCQLSGYGEGPPVALRVLLSALHQPHTLDWLKG